MKRIYISGKITGLNSECAKSLFYGAEKFLETQGEMEVINPMRYIEFVDGWTWQQYMIEDIKLLFTCTDIFMLNNWKDSKGAKIEHSIAEILGLNIVYQ